MLNQGSGNTQGAPGWPEGVRRGLWSAPLPRLPCASPRPPPGCARRHRRPAARAAPPRMRPPARPPLWAERHADACQRQEQLAFPRATAAGCLRQRGPAAPHSVCVYGRCAGLLLPPSWRPARRLCCTLPSGHCPPCVHKLSRGHSPFATVLIIQPSQQSLVITLRSVVDHTQAQWAAVSALRCSAPSTRHS